MTIICLCIVAGRNAEAVGESCCLYGALALCTFSYINIFSNIVIRGKIRDKFAIDESVVRDCLMSACGLCCAYTQHGQEIKTRQPQTGTDANVPEHEEIGGTRTLAGPV